MKSFSIGLQLYSVRGDMAANFYGTLKKVREMGYDCLEFAGLYGHSAAEIAELCAYLGLDPVSAHVPLEEMLSDPQKTMQTYAAIGCRYIAIPYLTPEYRPGSEKFPALLESVKMLGAEANRAGLTLLYHNHDFEFVKLDGQYGLDLLYRSVDASLLQTELDTCWVKVGGVDPSDYLRSYAGRAPVVHLKDFCGKIGGKMYSLIGIEDTTQASDAFQYRPIGYGVQDIPALLRAAEDAGSEFLIVEQDEPSMGKSPLECAALGIQKLRTFLTA